MGKKKLLEQKLFRTDVMDFLLARYWLTFFKHFYSKQTKHMAWSRNLAKAK